MLYHLIALLLIQASLSENTNFNYTNHGDDWTQGCKNGVKQSPIILTSNATPSASYLFGAYGNINATIAFYNTTTYLSGGFGQAFTMNILGKSLPFRATEVRIRSQSEHVIQFENDQNYTRFPLELQIFHVLNQPQSTNYRFAVGIHYQVGNSADPIIQSLIDAQTSNATSINIDFSYYIKRGNSYNYWFYIGSGTIPPCTDGNMNWIIIDQRFSITQAQADYFKTQFYGLKQQTGNYRNLKTTTSDVGYYTFGA